MHSSHASIRRSTCTFPLVANRHPCCPCTRPLPGVSTSIFHGITDLFDAYLLATFLMFSGISLEQLVWKEDVITLRLRSTLLRILMADNSYSQQVLLQPQAKPTSCTCLALAAANHTSTTHHLERVAASVPLTWDVLSPYHLDAGS
jgi:hypothetical protein